MRIFDSTENCYFYVLYLDFGWYQSATGNVIDVICSFHLLFANLEAFFFFFNAPLKIPDFPVYFSAVYPKLMEVIKESAWVSGEVALCNSSLSFGGSSGFRTPDSVLTCRLLLPDEFLQGQSLYLCISVLSYRSAYLSGDRVLFFFLLKKAFFRTYQ